MWRKKMSWHYASNQRYVKIIFRLIVTIPELEASNNNWRSQSPSEGDELRLCPEASALAKPYALMIVQGAQRVPVDVLDELARSAIQQFQKIS